MGARARARTRSQPWVQVSEGNVLAHLGIIEQRTNEILQVGLAPNAHAAATLFTWLPLNPCGCCSASPTLPLCRSIHLCVSAASSMRESHHCFLSDSVKLAGRWGLALPVWLPYVIEVTMPVLSLCQSPRLAS